MAKRRIPEPDLGFPPVDFCVAFVNTGLPTASYLRRPRTRGPRKLIESFRDLVDWAVTAGGVGEDEARRLLAEADERPDEAAAVVSRALQTAVKSALTAVCDLQTAVKSALTAVCDLQTAVKSALTAACDL